jgi:hypothetical protein
MGDLPVWETNNKLEQVALKELEAGAWDRTGSNKHYVNSPWWCWNGGSRPLEKLLNVRKKSSNSSSLQSLKE